MKQDMDLLRLILLETENDGQVDLSGYTIEQINYHKALLIDAHLLDGKPHYSSTAKSEIPDKVIITKLTLEGHKYLDDTRNNTIWEKAKKLTVEKGLPFSIDILKSSIQIAINQILGK